MRIKNVGLVLGCGAVAGAAWSIPVLDELQKQLQWNANEADVLIGTSVGAVLATLLASGLTVEKMMASQRGELAASRCGWNHDVSTGPWYPPVPQLKLSGSSLVARGLRKEVSPLTAISGLLPRGQFDMAPFVQLVDAHVPQNKWVDHKACWIMAVDNETGKRVAFGQANAPAASQSKAVCASYGVPGWCPPVDINGRTYIDGGVVSPTSADLLADTGIDVAIVLAPMASRNIEPKPRLLDRIERSARRYMTAIVDREVELLERAGKTVIRLEPGAEDLQAIGFNMMDPRRRERVFQTAMRTAPEAVRRAIEQAT